MCPNTETGTHVLVFKMVEQEVGFRKYKKANHDETLHEKFGTYIKLMARDYLNKNICEKIINITLIFTLKKLK